MHLRKGLFITFEGGEGAGKTTLINELSKKLNELGLRVIITREPGGTKLGEEVRSILLDHNEDMPICPRAELCLFLASRAQHVEEVIAPSIEEGKIVLCDRFHDSSVAYQGVARGLGKDSVFRFSSFSAKELKPNLTFYLDVDPKVGLKRGSQKHDRIESEDISFHESIRKAYLDLAKEDPTRLHVIDALQSPKEVSKLAFMIIEEHLEKV